MPQDPAEAVDDAEAAARRALWAVEADDGAAELWVAVDPSPGSPAWATSFAPSPFLDID